MRSTMMDYPLTVTQILRHGARVHGDSQVVTWEGDDVRRASFRDVYESCERLAKALSNLGVGHGDRVGTFCWNTQEHLEAYLAVPAMGAVLHTLNIRLFPEQLAYVINDAEDKVIIVDDSLVPLLARVRDQLSTVERFVVVGDGDASPLGSQVVGYRELLASENPGYAWPELDEYAAAAMCYTSGTTGNPKGVVYSHRSNWCHTFGAAAGGLDVTDADRLLLIVPMFHANGWGLPYIGWASGADFLMPERHLQPEPLARMIAAQRPTYSAAVPTIWNGLLQYGEQAEIDLSSLHQCIVGGAAVPRALIEAFRDRYGVEIVQGWGMTEMSPLGALAIPPADAPPEEELDWRSKTGRVVPGVDMRIVDEDGEEQPWDGKAIGEIEVRGPWITAGYYGLEEADDKFDDGWLRTGDVGTIDPRGFMQIVDRSKDVIKSGGEWISSVDLENELMAHADVVEAAVIGVDDEKWDERPLACVVSDASAASGPEEWTRFLRDRVAKWWVPERWSVLDEIPKTSVGKFDKKALRSRHAAGELEVTLLER